MNDFSKLPFFICTLNTETRGLHGELFRVGLFDGDRYYRSSSFSDIKEILRALSIAYDVHIYIHNLDFDLSKIAKLISKEITFKNSLFILNRAVTVVTDIGTFHDSYTLLGNSSLAKLCEDFGLAENGKMDFIPELEKSEDHIKYLVYDIAKIEKRYDPEKYELKNIYKRIEPKINKKETAGVFFENVPADDKILDDYLKLDCTSLYDLLSTVMDIAKIEPDQFIFAPTIASLTMKLFRLNYPEDFEQATLKKWFGIHRMDELFLRRAYYGGRTEVFTPVLTKGYHYDVVSLYPYVMKVNEYPVGKYYKKYEGMEAGACFRVWRRKRKGAGFLKCKVHIPKMNIPPLPIRSSELKKLVFPTGEITGTWTFHEIDLAIEEGCHIIEFYECIFWKETADLFSRYINHWEAEKNNSTGARRQFAKLMLNNFYGKFGTQRTRTSYTDNTPEELENLHKKGIDHDLIHFRQLDREVLRYDHELNSDYIQVQLSAYVTSYARIYLYKMLRELEKRGATIFYCDTDSIVSDIRIEDFAPDLVGEKVFGKWTLEKELNYGLFLFPKMYYEEYEPDEKGNTETKKGKGIPNEILLEQWNRDFYEFMIAMIKDERMEKIPIYEQRESRQKFLTALKQDRDFDRLLFMTKAINLQTEQKRKMDYKNNRSTPHELFIDEEQDQEKYFEEVAEQNKLNADIYTDWYDVKQTIKEHGYIRCMFKGEKYYYEYKQFSPKTRRLFFRSDGIPFEEFCSYAGYDPNLLIEDFRLAYID